MADVESIRSEIVRLSSLAARNVRAPHGETESETAAESEDDPTADLAPFATLDLVDQQALDEVTERLEEMRQVLAAQQQQIADIALVATDSAERTQLALDALDERMAAAGPDDESRAQLEQLSTKVASLDDRVNQVSLELTNQLTELSGDLDRVNAHADATELVEKLSLRLDDVTGGQERLANEQARYAIQFREDLAELAERLRRPNAR